MEVKRRSNHLAFRPFRAIAHQVEARTSNAPPTKSPRPGGLGKRREAGTL